MVFPAGLAKGQPDFHLFEIVHYQDSLQFLALGVFSKIDGRVGKDAVQAEIFTFEYCGFCSTLDFADLVNGILRHNEMARDYHGHRVEADGVCYSSDSCLVVAELGKVTVTKESRLLVFFCAVMREFPELSPDFLLKFGSEQHQVFPPCGLSQLQHIFKGNGSGGNLTIHYAIVGCLSTFLFPCSRLRCTIAMICLCQLS